MKIIQTELEINSILPSENRHSFFSALNQLKKSHKRNPQDLWEKLFIQVNSLEENNKEKIYIESENGLISGFLNQAVSETIRIWLQEKGEIYCFVSAFFLAKENKCNVKVTIFLMKEKEKKDLRNVELKKYAQQAEGLEPKITSLKKYYSLWTFLIIIALLVFVTWSFTVWSQYTWQAKPGYGFHLSSNGLEANISSMIPSTEYFVLNISENQQDGTLTVLYKLKSPSFTGYIKREIDCHGHKSRILGKSYYSLNHSMQTPTPWNKNEKDNEAKVIISYVCASVTQKNTVSSSFEWKYGILQDPDTGGLQPFGY